MTASPADPSLPRAVRFARLWRSGGVRRIEAFLEAEAGEVSRDDLLDLIQQEMQLRLPEVPTADEYRTRFPAVADQIGALFAVNALLDDRPDESETPDLPQYRVEGRLGRGAIGEVFRACDVVLGRPLAVKVLRPEWQDDPAAADRFWHEACTAARLQHPGVAPVYEAGYSDADRPYIAMKLVEGRTLAELLADRSSPADGLDRLVGVFEHVCQTMAYAHSRAIIHRDLKPANVMVGAFGEVQVMDWGLACEVRSGECGVRSEDPPDPDARSAQQTPHCQSNRTQAGEMVGTPAYAAPEQTRGDHALVTRASDVFGLGAILCEILTGRSPFDSVDAARAGHVGPAHQRLRAVPGDGLAALAIVCLAIDPKDRPVDGTAVAAAVAEYRADQQQRLRAAELAAVRAKSEARARRRAERLQMVGVLIVLAIVLGLWAWFSRQATIAEEVRTAADEGRKVRDDMIRIGDPNLLPAAERAARRAEGLLQGVIGRPELRARVAELLADLEGDARDPELVRRLERIRLDQASLGERDLSAIDAQYVAAFRTDGIDLTADADTVATWIASRSVRHDLVVVLDYWASLMARTDTGKERAIQLFAVSRRADPDEGRNAVREALAVGDPDQLLKAIESADLPAHLAVTAGTMLCKHPKHGKDGIRILHAVRRRTPNDFWANHNLAFYLCQVERKFADSIPYFMAAVALRPQLARVRVNLGNAQRAAGNVAAAVEAHRDAIGVEPTLAVAHFNLSNALNDLGDVEAAVMHARAVVQIDPAYRNGLFRLGALLARLGAREEARAALARAAETTSELECHLAYADALRELGRFADAAAVLQRLRELVRADPGQAKQAGTAHREANELIEIERDLAKVEAGVAEPKTAAAIWQTAWVCALTGRDARAVGLVRRALALDPASEHRPRGASELFHVAAALRIGDRAAAREWLQAELAAQLPTPDGRRAILVWPQHHDLAAVRDMAKLPVTEREVWKRLWERVEARGEK